MSIELGTVTDNSGDLLVYCCLKLLAHQNYEWDTLSRTRLRKRQQSDEIAVDTVKSQWGAVH